MTKKIQRSVVVSDSSKAVIVQLLDECGYQCAPQAIVLRYKYLPTTFSLSVRYVILKQYPKQSMVQLKKKGPVNKADNTQLQVTEQTYKQLNEVVNNIIREDLRRACFSQ